MLIWLKTKENLTMKKNYTDIFLIELFKISLLYWKNTEVDKANF